MSRPIPDRAASRAQTSFLGLLGVVGPMTFTLAWVACSLIESDYSLRREDISALAAETADNAWLMIAGFLTMGACTAAFAVGLWVTFRGSLRQNFGPILIFLAGVCIDSVHASILSAASRHYYPPVREESPSAKAQA